MPPPDAIRGSTSGKGGSDTLMIDSIDVETLSDGTCRIRCRTVEKFGILTALHWARLEVLQQDEAVFPATPPAGEGSGTGDKETPVSSFIIVRGSYADVSSAVASMVKTIRPYPPT